MKWLEVSITTTEYMQDAVTNIFYDVGAGGVVIEDPRVIKRYLQEEAWDYYEFPEKVLQAENVVIKGYLPMDHNLPDRMEDLKLKLESLQEFFENYYGEITTNQIQDEDWENAWKSYYKPHKVGKKIVVIPSWEDYTLQDDEVPIYLDPGMAFGTGTHPTTELCLKLLQEYLQNGDNVYDVGTGSGILAIAQAKLGAKKVLARDLDEVAVKMAVENVKRNNMEAKVKVEKGDLLKGIKQPVQLITANIIADVIINLCNDAYNLLSPRGIFICSGIIEDRTQDVSDKLINVGFEVLETVHNSGWVAIVAQRK